MQPLVQTLKVGNSPFELQLRMRDIIASGMLAEGKNILDVETKMQHRLHASVATVNSCGSALYLLFRYLHEVRGVRRAAVQNNTFYATGAMLAEAHIKPVLVDSAPNCPSMGVESLKKVIEHQKVDLVVLTHVGGWVAEDYRKIAELCARRKVLLVEDCAHAWGIPEAPVSPGSLGYASCWSFYPTKAMPAGEGGAVSSLDEDLIAYVKHARAYGKHKVGDRIVYGKGFNLRMSEWDAAVLSVQLGHEAEIMKYRAADAAVLSKLVPCALTGPSNYYKYPVHKDDSKGYRRVGHVYQRSDQLDVALGAYDVEMPVPLEHSHRWAEDYCCLWMGEGILSGLSLQDFLTEMKD